MSAEKIEAGKSVYVVGAKRSAIGNFGGALTGLSPRQIGAPILNAALTHAGFSDPAAAPVDEVIVGNVLAAGHGMNVARQVTLDAGLAASTPAYAVNRVCGSGLQSVMLGAQAIAGGYADLIVAGGVESMSQAGFISLGMRWGARMGHAEVRDVMISDGLSDAFHQYHMGMTAENLAEKFKIPREKQDEFAAASQQKAERAIAGNLFASEISSLVLMERGKPAGEFLVDEYPRKGTTQESLAKLRPAFKKDGTVTAGNASGINDGAAFLVLASEATVTARNLTPLARITGFAAAGVAPEVMGTGPIEAVKRWEARTGLSRFALDRIEANEAFAVQAITVQQQLELEAEKINPTGGAIALGHPIGASGARVLVTLVHGLIRDKQRTGLATLCVGGGQGVALSIERV